MSWINCIFGLLILKAITCSRAISHGKSIRIQRSVDTGKIEVMDPKDPKYLEFAKLSMKKYKADVGSNEKYLVLQVTSATEQVIAGLLTEIEFYVLQTPGQFPNGDIITPATVLSCDSVIVEQPWLRTSDINVSCEQVFI